MVESVADLERLYHVEATFEYTSRDGLVRDLCAFDDRIRLDDTFQLDHTVLITQFPPKLIEVESEGSDWPAIPPKKKTLYFPDSQILIYTMAGAPHEMLVQAMNNLMYEKLKTMNCWDYVTARGAPKEILENLNKTPDASWGPDLAGYPTCVLEVGASESLRQLDCDAHRWIGNEASHVTQVITAKIYPHKREMIFALWRRTADRQAVKADEICMEWHDGKINAKDNKIVRISFEQIFERPPTRGTADRDMIFSERDFGSIVRKIWREMHLIPSG